jgi:hypothetical protein
MYLRPNQRTTDATPKLHNTGFSIAPDQVANLRLVVFATDHQGEAAVWDKTFALRTLLSGAAGIRPADFAAADKKNTPGAAAGWLANVSLQDNTVYVQVTGAAGQTVDWTVWNDDPLIQDGVFEG